MMLYNPKWLLQSTLITILGLLLPCSSVFAAVIASIKPLGFIAAELTDGIVETEVLLPDGASPHHYALRPSDIQRLQKADLVLWVGPEMETFLAKPLQKIEQKRQIVLAEVEEIKKELLGKDSTPHTHHKGEKTDHHHAQHDMHIWMSIPITQKMAIAIHHQLSELLPNNRVKLDENLHKFEQQLKQVKENVAKMVKPVQSKGYFVFHDAYGYFENEFGLEQLGYFTINPEIQPGAQRLNQIRAQLVERKAVCVFAEPQFKPTVIQTVVQGTHVRIGTLDPLGSDVTLGKGSYVSYISKLAEQFVKCLKGD